MGNPFEKAPVRIEQTCPSCKGKCVDAQGKTCNTCHGTGKVNRS